MYFICYDWPARDMTHIRSLNHNILSLTEEGHAFDEWTVQRVALGYDSAPQEAERTQFWMRGRKTRKRGGNEGEMNLDYPGVLSPRSPASKIHYESNVLLFSTNPLSLKHLSLGCLR